VDNYARRLREGVGLVLAISLSMVPAMPIRSHVHEDADGSRIDWYPKECCNDGDCRPVSTIKPAPNGLWLTTVDGFTVLVGPRDRRRPSRDMRWHICMGPEEFDDAGPRIFCVFEPPNAGSPEPQRTAFK
jgi:hypothetical protein